MEYVWIKIKRTSLKRIKSLKVRIKRRTGVELSDAEVIEYAIDFAYTHMAEFLEWSRSKRH